MKSHKKIRIMKLTPCSKMKLRVEMMMRMTTKKQKLVFRKSDVNILLPRTILIVVQETKCD